MQSTAEATTAAPSPTRWRLWLSLAGLALGVLPLGQAQWTAALAAGAVGLVVVGAWAWGSSRKSLGLAVGGGLLAAMAGVFAISQWPRGLLAAPVDDWLGFWVLIGGAVLAMLVVDRAVHHPTWRRQTPSTVATAPQAQWITVVSVLSALLLICGCGFAIDVLDTNNGTFRFPARDIEVLPVPSTLRLISADSCADGGSSGNCVAEFVVTAADGAARTTTVDRIIDHLRRLGWPLESGHSQYRGCRDVGGILPWTPHCLSLYTDAEPAGIRPPAHPEAVTIYIDNS